jgi:hypothetical protein
MVGNTISQPVEKVRRLRQFDKQGTPIKKERISSALALINLLRFCPVAINTPSIFTFIKPP